MLIFHFRIFLAFSFFKISLFFGERRLGLGNGGVQYTNELIRDYFPLFFCVSSHFWQFPQANFVLANLQKSLDPLPPLVGTKCQVWLKIGGKTRGKKTEL